MIPVIATLALLAAQAPVPAQMQAPLIDHKVVASYPRDSGSFTQGLLYLNGKLFESAGLYGRSDVRMTDLKTGKVLVRQPVPAQWFAEGLARIDQQLYQLTWRAGIGIVYRLPFLKPVAQFSYPGEGWGLTFDGQFLIMSDGSSTLRFINPQTFALVKTVQVEDAGRPIEQLNELEYVDGVLFANIWRVPRIARIDPASGRVTGWLLLDDLYSPTDPANVLNGIAWNPREQQLLVTGKRWPKIFALKLR